MTTCLGMGCSFGLPRVPFVNCCQFIYLVVSLLVMMAGCGIRLYRLLIIAYLSTLNDWRDFMRAHSLFVLWYQVSKKSLKGRQKITLFNFVLLYVNVLFLSFVGIYDFKVVKRIKTAKFA